VVVAEKKMFTFIFSLLLKKDLRAIFHPDDPQTLSCLLLWRTSGQRNETEGTPLGGERHVYLRGSGREGWRENPFTNSLLQNG